MIVKLASRAIDLAESARTFGLARAFTVHAGNFMKRQSRSTSPKLKQVRVHDIDRPLHYRAGTSDWPVLKKIFISQEYEIPSQRHKEAVDTFYNNLLLTSKSPVIIDCGANIGLASVWYANRFPRATIYAVEPEPNNFAVLVRNCRDYCNIVPVQAAASDNQTMVSLSNASEAPWAWETKEGSAGTVKTVTIPDLVSKSDNAVLFIAKIDIEGFEVELFRSNVQWAGKAAVVVYESHDGMFPWRGTAHAILSVLSGHRREYLQRGENMFAISHSMVQADPLG